MIELLTNPRLREYHGVDSEKVFSGIGEQIGHALARKITASDPNGLLSELTALCADLEIARLDVLQTLPTTVRLGEKNGGPKYSEEAQKAFRAFNKALLRIIFQDKLGIDVDVKVTENPRDVRSQTLYEIHSRQSDGTDPNRLSTPVS